MSQKTETAIGLLITAAVIHLCIVRVFVVGSSFAMVVEESCREESIPDSPDLMSALDDVLLSVVESTPGNSHSSYYNYHPGHFFGHGACDRAIEDQDCVRCLRDITERLYSNCRYSIGARVLYKDCRIRYETYHFHEG